jgi:chemotaxis protein histidine kinase CheA
VGSKKTKPKPGEGVDKARPRVMRAASEDDEEDEETEKARRSSEDEDEEDEEDEDSEDTEKAEDEEDDEEDEEDGSGTGKARTRAKRGARAGDGETGNQPRGRPGNETDKADDDELVLPAAAKNAILRVLAQALERLMAVANQVKEADAPDDDTDPNVPDDLAAELEDIGELLEDVGEQLADPAAKAEGKKPGAAKGQAAKGDVAKAGRRMAKDRLDRFQKALEQLSAILKELTDAKAPPEPSAGSAANPLTKRNVPAGVDGILAELGKLTNVVKQQEARIVQLQKTGATSNAIPVEGGSRGRAVQDVSWPLDMNRPITRDRVDKAISFYDEE